MQTALARNAGVRAGGYEVRLQQALRQTASDLGKTNVTLMHGQYNSLSIDNNLTISQSIPFPTVISRQADVARATARTSEARLAVTRNELLLRVKSAYYALAFAQARQRRLLAQDSLYANFARAAGVRFRTGETNLLEKATADAVLAEARTRLAQNAADIRIHKIQLQTLLQHDAPVEIADTTLPKRPLPDQLRDAARPDSVQTQRNPLLAFAQQQLTTYQKAIRLERARLLPEFNVGYFNQSLIGFQKVTQTPGAAEQFYDGNNRFVGWTAGVSVPLWFRPQAARIRAATLGEQLGRANAELAQRTLAGQYAEAFAQYDKFRESVDYYERDALPQAALILDNAQKAFRGGDIGYLEYAQALTRALTIQTNYLDSVNQYNQAVIQLEFLAGNENNSSEP